MMCSDVPGHQTDIENSSTAKSVASVLIAGKRPPQNCVPLPNIHHTPRYSIASM